MERVLKSSLGFALIGCGDISEINCTSLQKASGSHLVRVADIDLATAERVAHQFDVPASSSLEEALSDDEVEAVFLSVPHHLHCPMITTAAASGRHVIVEKPIATRSEDALAADASCKEAGVALSVCHPRRYEPKVEHSRKLLADGVIGNLLATNSLFLKVKKDSYWTNAPWRGEIERSGGGVFLMNLIHHLDALQVVSQQQIVKVRGFQATLASTVEVEDTIAAILEFGGGPVGTVTGCSAAPGPTVITDTFIGSEGRIELTKNSVRVVSHEDPFHIKEWTDHDFGNDTVSKTRFVEEFSRAVLEGTPCPVPAAYGIDLARLILDCR